MKNISKKIRRGLYIAISLFGIGYELLRTQELRWPLLTGYLVVIGLTIYSFQIEKSDETEESQS